MARYDLASAQVYDKGTYFKPGMYDLKVIKAVEKESQSSGPISIVEFEIVKTSDPVNHPVGSKATWIQKLTDKKVALGALKEFIYAVLGKDPRNPQDTAAVEPKINAYADAMYDENALAGLSVHLQTSQTKTKKGMDFTRHAFSPAKG